MQECKNDNSKKQINILIVDDDPFNIDALETIINCYQDLVFIDTALSGQLAIL